MPEGEVTIKKGELGVIVRHGLHEAKTCTLLAIIPMSTDMFAVAVQSILHGDVLVLLVKDVKTTNTIRAPCNIKVHWRVD